MIRLYDEATEELIGDLTEEELDFMHDQLEEEHADDDDYYINQDTIDLFAARGGDPHLITLLRTALGSRSAMDVRWVRED